MSETLRIATWNMKQAVAPKKPLEELWRYMDEVIDSEIVILTEARVPQSGLPEDWDAIWTPGGIGPRRAWGTIVAARRPIQLVRPEIQRNAFNIDEYEAPAPASVETVDVYFDDYLWGTIIGVYAFMPNSKNGEEAFLGIAFEVLDVIKSGRERVLVGGDFNLLPRDLNDLLDEANIHLYDLVGEAFDFKPMPDGIGESRIWTHKNGNSPNAAKQEIDFMLATEELAHEMEGAGGGVEMFADAWDYSDHAPVVVDFRVD